MDSLLPRPVPLLSTLAFFAKDIQSIRSIQHAPPPPDLYQSRQAYWGNPYSTADSDDDSEDMSAAASNPTVALAGLTTEATEATEAVTVVADAVDASDVIADKYTPIAYATITDAHIGVEHAVIADVGAVPATHNNFTTTPYNNLMSASRRESAGWSVEPSNVNGINKQHEMWIRQCTMKEDWGIQYPHEFQIRAIHHIAFQRDQILYLVAKTGSGKSAIPLTIGSLQTGVTLSMVPLVGLGSDQVNNSRNSTNLIEAYHLDENRGVDGYALRRQLLSLHPRDANRVSIFLYASPQSLKEGSFWYKCLFQLASMNLIRLICIDEAHTVAQDGRNFRPEFRSAATTLRNIYEVQKTKCNRIALEDINIVMMNNR